MAVERRRQPALKVEIPKDESPRFGRVGVIAVIGFTVGAVWPSLAHFKLVPNVPGQAAPAPGLGGEPVAAPSVPSGSASAEPSELEAPPAAKSRGPAVGELQVTSCKDRKQKHVEPCDSIAFDRLARPRLVALGECEGAERMNGVLSLGFELDFASGAIERVASGKSTSLRQAESDSLVDCAKKQFAGLELGGIEHQHDRYTLFYRIEFVSSENEEQGAAKDEAVAVTPASGKATVSWDVALVRSAPSRDGKVVARILSGTRVVVTGRNGDWYEIKYDAKGNQGWVFRTAIGM